MRRQHGIWLASDRPLYFDFLTGRGNGTFLLAAGLANGLIGHAVSSTYFLVFASIVRALLARATADGAGSAARALFPDLALLLVSIGLLDDFTFGKYYQQTAAWLLGLLYGGRLYVTPAAPGRRALARMLAPLAVALPLTLPQYEVFDVAILGITAFGLALKRELARDRRLALLVGLDLAACAASLALNWLYIGIPELVPYWLFRPLIDVKVFDCFASDAVQTYTNYIQGYTGTFLNIHPGGDATVESTIASW